MKNKFDRKYIISQSSNNIYDIIDSSSSKRFGTSTSTKSQIYFEFQEKIQINGMIIKSDSSAFLKSFGILIDDEIVENIQNAEELNGKNQQMKILFSKRECQKIEIKQTDKSLDEDGYGILFEYIDFLSPNENYFSTVFRSMLRNSYYNPYLCPVHVSSTCFSPEDFLFDKNSFQNTCTFEEERSWIQIKFLIGQIIVNGMRIRTWRSCKMCGFELVGSNSDSNYVTESNPTEWTTIFSLSNQTIEESTFDFPPSGPFKYLRIIQTQKNSVNSFSLKLKSLDFFGLFKFSSINQLQCES